MKALLLNYTAGFCEMQYGDGSLNRRTLRFVGNHCLRKWKDVGNGLLLGALQSFYIQKDILVTHRVTSPHMCNHIAQDLLLNWMVPSVKPFFVSCILMIRQLLELGSRLLSSHSAPIRFAVKNPTHPDCNEDDTCIHDGTRLVSSSLLAWTGNMSARQSKKASPE